MTDSTSARRSFLTGLGATAVGLSAFTLDAHAQSPARTGRFQPARHAADDWMDAIPGTHRIVIDAVTPDGAGAAVAFANNIYVASKSGYGLDDKDIAVIVTFRHFATPFGYTDPIWAKYTTAMAPFLKFNDPHTKQPPTANVYRSSAYGLALPSMGNTIDELVKHGTQFAICDMATHFIAGQFAGEGGNAETIYKELSTSLVPNSHMVAAGVVGVTHAQERGYSLIYAG